MAISSAAIPEAEDYTQQEIDAASRIFGAMSSRPDQIPSGFLAYLQDHFSVVDPITLQTNSILLLKSFVTANAPATVLPTVVTGIIPAAGVTATAGTGFTYTHTNTSGIYVFTFTAAFAAAPTVVASVGSVRATNAVIGVTSVATTGFTVNTWIASTAAAADEPFSFIAYQTA